MNTKQLLGTSVLVSFALSGCYSQMKPQSMAGVNTANNVVAPGPSPSPSPSASPSPSPSASPSPTPYAFSGGAGTIGNPYALTVAEDIEHIGDFPSAYFQMNQSISMGSIVHTPIPNFSGVLYGNGYEIDNLVINDTSGVGALFQVMSGTLVSLNLVGVSISSTGYASGFTGSLSGSGLISHCTVSGTITSPLGGNGFNTGVGTPSYVTKASSASIITTSQYVMFNGFRVNNSF